MVLLRLGEDFRVFDRKQLDVCEGGFLLGRESPQKYLLVHIDRVFRLDLRLLLQSLFLVFFVYNLTLLLLFLRIQSEGHDVLMSGVLRWVFFVVQLELEDFGFVLLGKDISGLGPDLPQGKHLSLLGASLEGIHGGLLEDLNLLGNLVLLLVRLVIQQVSLGDFRFLILLKRPYLWLRLGNLLLSFRCNFLH